METNDCKTIHELFEKQVEKFPDKCALIMKDKSLTYTQLNNFANKLAHVLIENGVQTGSIVGIMAERSFDMIIGILAVLKAGGAYVPIGVDYPPARKQYILEDSGATVLLCKEVPDNNIEYSGNVIMLSQALSEHEDCSNPQGRSGPHDLAYIIYTSGSTGEPKGVMIEHRSIVNIITALQEYYPLLENDTYLLKTAYTFDVSVAEIFGWFPGGGRLAILEQGAEKEPFRILDAIKQYSVTHINFVPSMLGVFLDSIKSKSLTSSLSLKFVFAAGEALKPALVERFRSVFAYVSLENIYGPTESTIYATRYSTADYIQGTTVPIGKPLQNIWIYIVDEEGKLLKEGKPGELCISGVGLARGYINKPDLTAERFVTNPFSHDDNSRWMYKTGDLARWLPDGHIEYLGRIDHQVKIRGFRVELGEIEHQILKHGKICEVVVKAMDDEVAGNFLCAFIKSEERLSVTALRKQLAAVLPDYMIPSYFIQVDEFPRTSSGKIDVKQLPDPRNAVVSETEYSAPGDAVEEKLVHLWEDILKVKQIGIDDNFFHMGGHSLLVTTLIAKINAEMGTDIPIKALFHFPTVRQLAKHLHDFRSKEVTPVTPVEKMEYYPVSSVQKRLYILDQLYGSGTSYNEPFQIRISGSLDVEFCKAVLEKLIKRHEALRTSFEKVDGTPVQRVHDRIEFHMEVIEAQEDELVDIVNKFVCPFRMDCAPLMRAVLLRLDKDFHILLVDIHHIVWDGVSLEIFIRDFTALYNGQALKPLEIQYRDYAVWHNAMIGSEAFKKQEEYWLDTFKNDITVLNMPTDYPRPLEQSFEGETISLVLEKQRMEKLLRLAESSGATLFMVLLAAYNVLLYKYSGQEDVVVGSPVAGRRRAELEGVVGMFVNTLPIRNYPQGQKHFHDFLMEVKENCIRAYENQDFQLEELVEKLDIKRDLSRNPLFDTMLVLQNAYSKRIEAAGGLDISFHEIPHSIAKFDITLEAIEEDDGLRLNLNYCTKLFRKQTMEVFLGHFTNILEAIIENNNIKLSKIDILSEEEKDRIIKGLNAAVACHRREGLIHELFEEQVERIPHQPCVVYQGEEITYHGLNSEANRLARVLRDKGVGRDSLVGLMVERSIAMITGILAILKAGGAYLPIDPEYPEERIKYILEDSRAAILLSDRHVRLHDEGTFPALIINLKEEVLYNGDDSNLAVKNISSDLAYVIYTSGSTGNPKGSMIEHRNVINLVYGLHESIYKTYDIKLNIALLSSLSFDASVKQIFASLLLGHTLHIIPDEVRLDGERLLEHYRRYNIDISDCTPVHLGIILDSMESSDCTALKRLVVGGEALRPELVGKLFTLQEECRPALSNVYGPTECCDVTTVCNITDNEIDTGSVIPIGRPIPNTRVYLLDEHLNIVPQGVPGEIYISGAGVGRGYLNNRELTEQRFIPDPFTRFFDSVCSSQLMYRTGDMARWLPDGNIEFIGRLDNQVKVRGFRIELEEIEKKLAAHPMIREAVVMAMKDHSGDSALCAYLVGEEGLAMEMAREYLVKELPAYMVPQYFILLDAMPLTPNGKIDRRNLPGPTEADMLGEGYTAPENETEEKLVCLWQDILGIKRIGVTDNFFHLGGHSLKAIYLVEKVKRVFNADILLRDILRMPTIRQLAALTRHAGKSSLAPIKRADEKEFYPLSSAQKRLYLLDQFKNTGITYNMPYVMTIEGELDIGCCENAFKALVDRHEAFRTSFEMIGGEPVQRVHQDSSFSMEYCVMEQCDTDAEVSKFIRPFDLGRASLFRVKLVKLKAQKFMMMMDMHHIISDGMSMDIIFSEFEKLYRKEALPPIEIQYKDYAVWQNAMQGSEELKKQEEYWRGVFESELPVLNMPVDYSRPPEQSFEGQSIECTIGNPVRDKLLKYAKERGITLYTMLLAAYNVLLYKYTGQEDIVIGSPIAGRHHSGLGGVVGMFVNTLPMRNYPQGQKNFSEFLMEVTENCFRAYENQDFQFEELVEKLDIKRDLSRNPLFDTMFVLQKENTGGLKLQGLNIRRYEMPNPTAKFDITLEAIEEDDGLRLNLNYCTKLFRKHTMEDFLGHFTNILEAITENIDVKLSEIDILSAEEKGRLLYGFNDTNAAYPVDKSIPCLFEERAAQNPQSTAVVFGNRSLTYAGLNEKSNAIAHYLASNGVGEGSVVGVMMERSLELMTSTLGVLKAGAAYMPIDPDYPEERVHYLLSNSNTTVLLIQDKFKDAVNAPGLSVIAVEQLIQDEGLPKHNNKLEYNPERLMYVLYTSGSTGNPKGAMIKSHSFVNLVDWFVKAFEITSKDTVLLIASISFDLAQKNLYAPLVVGGRLCIYKPGFYDYLDMSNTIEKEGITIINCTPSAFYPLVDFNKGDGFRKLRSLRLVFLGGEPISLARLSPWLESPDCNVEVVNTYGPTECTDIASFYRIGKRDYQALKSVPIGKPINNARLFILDRDDKLAPVGVEGELCIAGVGVGRGYYNAPELTAEKFVKCGAIPEEVVYRTGDIVKWLPDGNIEFIGRLDNQVKVRGFRIELEEIEKKLAAHPMIREAVVMDIKDSSEDGALCAYLVGEEGLTVEMAREYLVKELPAYMVPQYFILLGAMPLTPNGKIDRRNLPGPTEADMLGEGYTAPENETEEKLLTIWQEVLKTNKIGVTSNFFTCGGHSLNAMFLINMVSRDFGVNISFATLFSAPTVRELAMHIKHLCKSNLPLLEPVEEREYYPTSSAQKRMFMINILSGGGVTYNVPLVRRIEGEIDTIRFEAALRKLVERHEAMRTAFELDVDSEEIMQKIYHVNFKFNIYSLGEEEINDFIRGFVRPFDLNNAPLFRAALIRIKQDEHIFIMDMHHIITDGRSTNIILHDLAALYEGQRLEELKLQYKDYAVWQNKIMQTPEIKRQEDYWLGVFKDSVPELNLPFDYPGNSSMDVTVKHICINAGEKLTEALNNLAAETVTTMHMVLMAVFNVLLAKLSGQQDIVVGIPVSGRHYNGLENIVGMFVETLAIRNYTEEQMTFTELLGKVKSNMLNAFENQDYPFEDLVDKLNVSRDKNKNPIFNVMFLFEKSVEASSESTLKFQPYGNETNTGKFDLLFAAEDSLRNLSFKLVYRTSLFTEQTAVRMCSAYIKILRMIAESKDIKIQDISID